MKTTIIPIIALASALAACQETTADNFTNPPPGVPATCTEIASLPGCDNGSRSYSCTSDRPDDVGSAGGDSQQLACSGGSRGPDGTMLYCCAPFSTYYTDCALDTTIAGCGVRIAGGPANCSQPPPSAR